MSTETKPITKERLHSLDTLRGFDMFWIIGGGALFGKLAEATQWPWLEAIGHQMHHAEWVGFRFFDLIFPLFMFISGVAIPFALTSRLEKGVQKSILYKKVFTRMLALFLLGLVCNGVLKNGFTDIRVLGVLAQIGIAYFFAAIIVINTRNFRTRLLWLIGILSGIGVLQFLVPVSGFGAGVLTPEGSINAFIDQLLLPGRLIYTTYDPEGILSIVSATSITLMGAIAGFVLRNKEISQIKKTKTLLFAGLALVVFALAISPFYPIIKKIWTSSFNILTAGISAILLAGFYYIIDVKKKQSWILFFKVIGLNSITIYMAVRLIDFMHTSEFVLGSFSILSDNFNSVILYIGKIGFEWLFLYYLYRKKIFLRV